MRFPTYRKTLMAMQQNHHGRLSFDAEGGGDAATLIEYLVSINNPDGRVRHRETKAKYLVADRCNFWPYYMHRSLDQLANETLLDDDISIFSMSKINGFASSRLGYAFVSDPALAEEMQVYVRSMTHGLVTDSQVRCAVAFRHMLDNLHSWQEYLFTSLADRWRRLEEAMSAAGPGVGFHLLNEQGPTAWFKADVPDARAVAARLTLELSYGPESGVGTEYFRVNMLCGPLDFDEFIRRVLRSSNAPTAAAPSPQLPE